MSCHVMWMVWSCQVKYVIMSCHVMWMVWSCQVNYVIMSCHVDGVVNHLGAEDARLRSDDPSPAKVDRLPRCWPCPPSPP